jgi:hypothetical protein
MMELKPTHSAQPRILRSQANGNNQLLITLIPVALGDPEGFGSKKKIVARLHISVTHLFS